jgi:putative acyl-CoA dehydrogenase
MMRLARAYDARSEDGEGLFARLATAVVKYWVCKRWPPHAAEALECLGGSGYVEESLMPRIYREAPLNSIWEGSGNVICLDVLRAMARGPEVIEAFFAELDEGRGGDRRLDEYVGALRRDLGEFEAVETRARGLVERMALALQAALLVRHGDQAVADAFCASRLTGQHGLAFGTLPAGVDATRIIDRARPVLQS